LFYLRLVCHQGMEYLQLFVITSAGSGEELSFNVNSRIKPKTLTPTLFFTTSDAHVCVCIVKKFF
jgi:hypothetical protein